MRLRVWRGKRQRARLGRAFALFVVITTGCWSPALWTGYVRRRAEADVGGMMDDQPDRLDLRGALGAQVGDGNIQHSYFAPVTQIQYTLGDLEVPLARSAYLEQVRRIAPPDPPGLIGREEELAELA